MYEYKFLFLSLLSMSRTKEMRDVSDVLNQYAQEGWEVLSTTATTHPRKDEIALYVTLRKLA